MENIELYKKEINSQITGVEIIEDEKVKISYGDSVLTIGTHHNQDCCERVYADFSVMKHYIDKLKDGDISNLVIKGVKDMGFLLCFQTDYGVDINIFIACYNYQNGYYSSALTLNLRCNEIETKVDISDFVNDNEG